MQDATQFGRLLGRAQLFGIAPLNVDAQLLFQYIDFLVECQRLLAEEPRLTEGGAAYHDGIYAILVEGTVGISQRLDVAIADDGDMDARILLYLANQRPVGLTGIHLAARATMDGQRLDATVLQLLGQRGDNQLLVIPSQAGLDGYGQLHGLHHLLSYLQ